jgi:asparagine synthase (glutamine-hydrolysing)
MCGIAGIVNLSDAPVDRDRLGAMLRHMRHRGPDGFGMSVDGRCGLAHARLSIIDLLSGHQPMLTEGVGEHGALRLVFNGEIYNHRELRLRLQKRGHSFHSDHSDTEALLLGYRQWGVNLPKHLHGMFAFAVWDDRERSLFVCRDRSGKKPLYLRRSGDHRELMFASLVATIVAGLPKGESAQVDPEALRNYLRLGYPFEKSMVRGIEELRPGHWMKLHADGRVECERYWQPPPVSLHSTALGAVDAVREVLSESIAERLEADVPLGCFLSGGVDSSVVAAFAQRELNKRGDRPLRTFSVQMPDALFDETPYAQQVASHIGSRHTVLQARPGDAMEELRRLMDVAGEPTADSSILPTLWLCHATREHVKVALSGDGGDELFGGYDRYRGLRLLQRTGWLAKALPGNFGSPVNPKATRTKLARFVRAAKAGDDPNRQYASMIHLFSERAIAELAPGINPGINPGIDPGISVLSDDRNGNCSFAPLPDWIDEPDVVHAAMRWDFTHYLPYEVLRKVDRASMAVALEVRCPLLDTAVCDLAGHLPTSVLLPGGRAKALLEDAGDDLLPGEVLRRPKRGFAVPLGAWLRTEWRDQAGDLLRYDGLDTLGINRSTASRMLEEHLDARADHSHRLFALMQLSLWAHWLKQPGTPPVIDASL